MANASIINFLDFLAASGDDEDARLAERLRAVDTSGMGIQDIMLLQGPAGPTGPIGPPGSGDGGGGVPPVDVGIRYASPAGDNTDGLSWQTAFHTVKETCIAAGRDSQVKIGKGLYWEEGQIPWHRGQVILGNGPWSTSVRLADSGTPPLFVSDPGLPNTEFMHGAQLRNLQMRGNAAAGKGAVIEINCRIGEENIVNNVQIHAAGGDGIHAKRGGQPAAVP